MTLDTAGSASARSTCIAMCRGRLPCPRASAGRWPGQHRGKAKARVRVEHPFRVASGCSAATWFGIGVWRGTCSGLRCFWGSRT